MYILYPVHYPHPTLMPTRATKTKRQDKGKGCPSNQKIPPVLLQARLLRVRVLLRVLPPGAIRTLERLAGEEAREERERGLRLKGGHHVPGEADGHEVELLVRPAHRVRGRVPSWHAGGSIRVPRVPRLGLLVVTDGDRRCRRARGARGKGEGGRGRREGEGGEGEG